MTASIDYIYEVSGSNPLHNAIGVKYFYFANWGHWGKKKKWRTIPKVKSLVNEKPLESK